VTLGDASITFNVRFSGRSTNLFVPVWGVLGICTRDNGQGMMFSEEPQGPEPPTNGDDPADGSDSSGKPNLRVVK